MSDQAQRPVPTPPGPQLALAPKDEATPAQRHVFLPKEFVEDLEVPVAVQAPSWTDRLGRPVIYSASAVVAVIGAVATYALLASPGGPRSAADPAPVPSLAVLDVRADTVALALAAFDLRISMFAEKKMGCADLARGLVQLDETLLSYGAARRQGPAGLDPPHAERDRALFAGASRAERQYERSGCARP